MVKDSFMVPKELTEIQDNTGDKAAKEDKVAREELFFLKGIIGIRVIEMVPQVLMEQAELEDQEESMDSIVMEHYLQV